MTKTMINLAAVGAVAAGLGGCAATGLTEDALKITKAESAATIAHLNATEPEFSGMASSSAGWVVVPGDMNFLAYLLGGGGGDGLLYTAGSTEPTGYTRHARVSVGLGSFGQYADYVIFLQDQAAVDGFKEGGWSIGGEAGWGIFGLAASGHTSFSEGQTWFSDPRYGGGLAAFFTFDNFSYNDISAAMGN